MTEGLRRAAELSDHDPETANVERSMTRAELWHATPNRNAQQSLSVRMRFREGRTRVVLEERHAASWEGTRVADAEPLEDRQSKA